MGGGKKAIGSLWVIIFIAVIIGFLLFYAVPQGSARGDAGGEDGVAVPVTPFGKPLDVVLVIDQSGSMLESDKSNVRVAAARFLTEYLASFRSEYFDHRMGVVNFGTIAPPEYAVAPTQLTSEGIVKVNEKIIPLNLGNTNVLAAFQEVKRLFESVADEVPRKKVVVLFTDGEPDIDNVTPASQLFPDIIAYFRNNLADTTLYVVGIDERNAFWGTDLPYWEQIAPGRAIKLERFDETELKKTYANIIAASFSDEKIEWFESTEADIEVEPYLESMNVVLLKGSPDARITVGDPDGNLFHAENVEGSVDNEAYTILNFRDPAPGTWRYEVSGAGKATIGFNKIPVKVRMLFPDPKSGYPRCRPLKILATFSRLDGTEVKEQAGVPLFPGATVTFPGGERMDVKLDALGRGVYESEETIYPEEAGTYAIRLYLKGGPIISETISELEVRDIPYAVYEGMNEVYGRNQSVTLKASMYLGGEKVEEPKSLFPDEDPRSIMYFVFDEVPEGSGITLGKAFWMEPGEGGVFRAREPVRLDREGDYLIRLVLAGKLANGEQYKSIPEYLRIKAKKTTADLLRLIFIILGSMIGASLLAWLAWHFTRPVISGELTITIDGEPVPIAGGGYITVRGSKTIYAYDLPLPEEGHEEEGERKERKRKKEKRDEEIEGTDEDIII